MSGGGPDKGEQVAGQAVNLEGAFEGVKHYIQYN